LYGYADGDPINFSDPFGLCPKDAGGDGETEEYGDCPKGSSGYYAHRASQWDSSAINTILGWGASCGENTACMGAAITLAVVGGAAVAGAGEALGLNQYLRAGMRMYRGQREFRVSGSLLDRATGQSGTHWTSTKVLNALKDLFK